MSDTWSDIQALKSRSSSLREKLARRKKEREGLVADITGSSSVTASPVTESGSLNIATLGPGNHSAAPGGTTVNTTATTASSSTHFTSQLLQQVEKQLQIYLSDVTLNFPIEFSMLQCHVDKVLEERVPSSVVEDLLQKFSAQQLICLDRNSIGELAILSADNNKFSAVNELAESKQGPMPVKRRKKNSGDSSANDDNLEGQKQHQFPVDQKKGESIESLLSTQSAKERESKKLMEEIQNLLSKPTAKEQSLVEKFRSQGGAQVKEFCQYGTREECMKVSGKPSSCDKLHFKKIINKHTDESLGDCSFLNTCFHMDICKYVHYEIDYPDSVSKPKPFLEVAINKKQSYIDSSETRLFPAEWVQCDMRSIDMSTLGKFSVVMADPPWDIHMELPYGTMSDDEMRKLQVPVLQDDGYIFLWVTGRAMELGRECLKLWGYERIDELIWVKTNQLQRIIRTGRTGHWLNHGKEHCLIGKKGNPKNVNRGLDCDVIVAEVRATSHKPDEIYGIIERLSPGTRKIELFGRPHNVQPNWVTLGNQLDGVRLLEPDVVKAFKRRYPSGSCLPTTQQHQADR